MFRRKTVPQLDAQQVAAQQDDVQILDVREHSEWRSGHVPGSRHIPLQQLPARLGELEVATPVVVVCRSGNRSDHAARFLAQHGYEAANLVGGLQAWAGQGRTLETDGGQQGRVA